MWSRYSASRSRVSENNVYLCGSGKKYKRCCGGATVN
ncbi:MAG: SEC-C metal-binding domain-containing protein [Candidatus Sulfotelmatobacter sp.]